jgi:peptidyl-dipeptidase A
VLTSDWSLGFRAVASVVAILVTLNTATARAQARPSVADAQQFVARTNQELLALQIRATRAQWIQQNFITDDTEALNAEVGNELATAYQRLAVAAKRFDGLTLPADLRRQLTLLKTSVVTQGTTAVAPPSNPKEATELATLIASMDGAYGRGKYCRAAKAGGAQECLDIGAITRIMATSRDPAELLDVWKGWNAVGAPMRGRYERFVTLANKGATELGYGDAGVLWRSIYDMPPAQFDKEVERVWGPAQAAV